MEDIQARLRAYQRAELGHATQPRAAVSIVLRPSPDGPDLLLIHRAERPGDPWSGQIALPGGRHQPEDPHLLHTAIRETREEVGLDLELAADPLGGLDDIEAIGRGQRQDLVITPYVHALRGPVGSLVLNPYEVQSAFWVPLTHLGEESSRTTLPYEIDGRTMEFPAFGFGEHRIWGLTYRILTQALDVIRPTPPRPPFPLR